MKVFLILEEGVYGKIRKVDVGVRSNISRTVSSPAVGLQTVGPRRSRRPEARMMWAKIHPAKLLLLISRMNQFMQLDYYRLLIG